MNSEKVKKKILLLGDPAVGKTSLIRRFVFDQFDDSYIATIGTKVSKKPITIKKDGKEIELTLMIWDVLGRQGYIALQADAFVGAHGAILVADLTRKQTLNSLESYWIPSLFRVVENVPLVFTANKADLSEEAEFNLQDLQSIAAKYNVGIAEDLVKDLLSYNLTSAKTGENVDNLFKSIAHLILDVKFLGDPIKERLDGLVAGLVSEGLYGDIDTGSPIGAADSIMVDFCKGFEDKNTAMSLLRLEFIRAGINIKYPSVHSLLKAIDYLAEVENEFLGEDVARQNWKKRLMLIENIKE